MDITYTLQSRLKASHSFRTCAIFIAGPAFFAEIGASIAVLVPQYEQDGLPIILLTALLVIAVLSWMFALWISSGSDAENQNAASIARLVVPRIADEYGIVFSEDQRNTLGEVIAFCPKEHANGFLGWCDARKGESGTIEIDADLSVASLIIEETENTTEAGSTGDITLGSPKSQEQENTSSSNESLTYDPIVNAGESEIRMSEAEEITHLSETASAPVSTAGYYAWACSPVRNGRARKEKQIEVVLVRAKETISERARWIGSARERLVRREAGEAAKLDLPVI